jgi:hypothetical protein
MRYHDRVRGVQIDDGDTGASGGADDDLGLSPEEWATAARQLEDEATEARDATAAETMAQEATEADGGTDDSDNTDDSDDTGEAATFADAFRPDPTVEPADRDDRYRARLRDSESEAERLRGTIEQLQRTEVSRLASARLADSADIYRDGAALADLCGGDGTVDPSKVDSTIDGLLQAHPYWAAPTTPYSGPLHSGATSLEFDRPTKEFVDAFRPGPKSE